MLHAPWSRRLGPCRLRRPLVLGAASPVRARGVSGVGEAGPAPSRPKPGRGVPGPGPRGPSPGSPGLRGPGPGAGLSRCRPGREPRSLRARGRPGTRAGARLRTALIGNRRRAPPPLRRAAPAGSLMPPPPPPGCSPLGSGESSLAGGTAAERDGQAVIPRRGQGG